MPGSLVNNIASGAIDTVLTGTVAAGIGSVVALLAPSLGVPVVSGAIFSAVAGGVLIISYTAIDILFKPQSTAAKLTAHVVSWVAGIAAGFALTTALGMPLSLGVGLGLTAAVLVSWTVAVIALPLIDKCIEEIV